MTVRSAVITGATGFLGLNIVHQLLADQWQVTALCRPTSEVGSLTDLGVQIRYGDIGDPQSLREAIPEKTYAVFHVAGNTSLWSKARKIQYRDNVIGTRNIAAVCLERKVRRLVHTSSIAAYGMHDSTITEASEQLGQRSKINYFRTKALAEQEARAVYDRGLDLVILNPANIVGPHDRANWSRMIRMVADQSLPGIPPGAGSFCHAREVARAHVAAAEIGGSGKNYLLGGADATFEELIGTIAAEVGQAPPARVLPGFVLRAVGYLNQWSSYLTRREPDITPEGAILASARILCSSARAIEELEYRPISLEEMVRDCAQWLRSQGLLTT